MKWKLDLNARASAGGRIDGKGPAETNDALMHPKQSNTSLALGIKPYAVVVNRKDAAFGVFGQENTVDARFVFIGEIVDEITIEDFDDQAATFGDFATLPFESGDKTEIVEHGRPQEKGHIADLVHAVLGQQPDLLESTAAGVAALRRVDKVLDIHEEGRQSLGDLIVKLSRDGASFVLLSVHEPLGECLQFALAAQALPILLFGTILQARDIQHADGRKDQADANRQSGNVLQAAARFREYARDLHLRGL